MTALLALSAALTFGASLGPPDKELRYLQLLALRAPDKLPPQWKNLKPPEDRCLTPFLREIQRDLPNWPEKRQQEMTALLRPDARLWPYLDSDTFPIRVHYPDSAWKPTASEALVSLNRSWQIEVLEVGFRAPLPDDGFGGSDALDVYIWPGSGGAGTIALSTNPQTPWSDYSTFITLDPFDYGGALLGVTLCHEFNHASQAAYDWWETIVAMESTATFVEDLVYDDINDHYEHLDKFQRWPHEALDYIGGTWAWYVYAANLYHHFLRDHYGAGDPGIVVDMWENSRQIGSQNEPDFIDGLEIVLPQWGVSGGYFEAARTFAQWRYFIGSRDDGAHFEEGAAMPEAAQVPLIADIPSQSIPILISAGEPVAESASSYVRVNVSVEDRGSTIQVHFEGEGSGDWALDAMSLPRGGGAAIVTPLMDSGNESNTMLTLGDVESVVFVVTHLGDGMHDPEDKEWGGEIWSLGLETLPTQ